MSSSSDQNSSATDGKIATGTTPAGMDSITNTVGMHPQTNQTAPEDLPPPVRRGSCCQQPGCTTEHSGKPHD